MNGAAIDVSALALSYRRLVLWFGAQLVIYMVGRTAAGMVGETLVGAILALLYLIGTFAAVGALAYYAYRTEAALGSRVSVLWALAMLVPLANAITLVFLSSKATTPCRAQGIPVGLLGPKLARVVNSNEAGGFSG